MTPAFHPDVDRAAFTRQHLAELVHRSQRGEVQYSGADHRVGCLGGDPVHRGGALLRIPHGHDHLGAGQGKPSRDFQPEAITGPSHQRQLSAQIGDVDVCLLARHLNCLPDHEI
jgi:hypothetical protein